MYTMGNRKNIFKPNSAQLYHKSYKFRTRKYVLNEIKFKRFRIEQKTSTFSTHPLLQVVGKSQK